ncbi:major facilitator superfamily domain-containing protein [Daldinia decipiens]|uniref:major facilitator superfamily domain-containing protein n=1 Tax=Daldinia decipiens TaxID=326647 RepID=UPI0020C4A3F5|nr:major facilitator superfamily domain-containing protein [Daldinia decipiens]KAI1656232.1 major facilitator superfamily domain-containing protein [Daldinia decipiens]
MFSPEQRLPSQMATKAEPTLPGSTDGETASKPPAKGLRFWGIFASVCLLSFISALDVSIITTALPTITAEIGGAEQYVWIANSFIVASSVLQPLFGQVADAFGRQIPIITATTLFTLGSGLAGGAYNVGMLIAGRTVQGIGAGGIYVLIDIVCCDLVPLRERGKYLGLMFSWSGVAAALGPPVGGALAQENWRWVFWINIPICGLALFALVLFMRVNKGADSSTLSLISKAKRIDYFGSLIFIPSMIALLFGLIMGGVQFPWSSWRVILPLVLGIAGWIFFHIQQHYFARHPSVPSRLFGNRTSVTAFILTFTSSVILQMISYFLPIYFQAVLATTTLESGTFFLPFALGSLVFAVVAGALLTKFGAYRPLHATAFALLAVSFGLFTLLDGYTTKVAWAFFELIASGGCGMIISTLLPAIMAKLPESDVVTVSATFSFIKNFGYIWGVTISSIVFNAVFDSNLYNISDQTLRSQLQSGAAYSFASQVHTIRSTLDLGVWVETRDVYTKSLRIIWWVGLGISLASFFAVAGEEGLELRKELETEYGINDQPDRSTNDREKLKDELKTQEE